MSFGKFPRMQMPVNPFTLRFLDATLEQDYQTRMYFDSLWLLRMAIAMAAVIHAIYLYIDYLVLGDGYETMWKIRIFLLIPSILAALYATYHPGFIKHKTIILASVAALTGLALSLGPVIYGSRTAMYFAPGTIMVAMYIFFLLGLSFYVSVLISWSLITLHIIINLLSDVDLVTGVNAFEVLFISNSILTTGAYRFEWISRESYVNNLLKEESNRLREEETGTRIVWLESMAQFLRHELNNSLVAVSTSLDLVKRKHDIDEGDKYMERTRKSIGNINRLIHSASMATSMESAILSEEREMVNMGKLIGQRLEEYKAIHPGNRIMGETLDDNIHVQANPDKLIQMLDNIVNNAVAHCFAGTPVVIVLHSDGKNAVLSVQNDGVGLPEDREAIFDLFSSYREQKHQDSKRGFGLYIVKLIVEGYGGTVTVRDFFANRGAVFTVRLPLFQV